LGRIGLIRLIEHFKTPDTALAATEPIDSLLPEPVGTDFSKLDLTPRHCDELAGESGLTPMELSAILLHLELQGYAEKLPGGRYIRGCKAH